MWPIAYDERGNRTSVTDPAGGVATFTYDAQNTQAGAKLPLRRQQQPRAGQGRQTTTRAYDAEDGAVILKTPRAWTLT